jgi:hypothetical protein
VQGVTGSVAKGGDTTVTLVGSAAYTSTTSYVCTANATGTTNDDPINVVNNSATTFTLYNSGDLATATTISYNCVGH